MAAKARFAEVGASESPTPKVGVLCGEIKPLMPYAAVSETV